MFSCTTAISVFLDTLLYNNNHFTVHKSTYRLEIFARSDITMDSEWWIFGPVISWSAKDKLLFIVEKTRSLSSSVSGFHFPSFSLMLISLASRSSRSSSRSSWDSHEAHRRSQRMPNMAAHRLRGSPSSTTSETIIDYSVKKCWFIK